MNSKGTDKMAVEQNRQSRLVPKLRFPEFQDADGWEFKTLSHLLSEPKRRNRDLKYGPEDVLSVSGEHGCVNQIEFMGRSYAGVSVKDYHVVETGDVVYTKSPLKVAPFGIIKANKGRSGIVSTLYAVYRPTANARADYIDHYFSRNYNLNSFLQPIVKKGAKNDMKVKNSDVLTGSVWVPKIDEQKKIADCLSSIDTLIAAEAEKLEALKDHKKGLLQQLFPAPGETIPRLRFPEFQDAGDWGAKRLGSSAKKVGSGITPKGGNSAYSLSGRPFMRSQNVGWGELLLENVAFIDEKLHATFAATEIRVNDVLLNITGASIGRSAIADSRISGGNVNQHVCIIRLKEQEMIPSYLNQFLLSSFGQSQIDSFQAGGNRQGLNFEQIRSFEVPCPPALSEQERIADCLSTIDTLVAAQGSRIDTLKAHKQGLMQQIFPVADGVLA